MQFGFEISFESLVISFSLIPYTTSGTSSFILNTEELSITNDPLLTNSFAYSLDLSPPAEKSEMSYSSIFSFFSSLTGNSLSLILISLPSEDLEAKSEYSTSELKFFSHN